MKYTCRLTIQRIMAGILGVTTCLFLIISIPSGHIVAEETAAEVKTVAILPFSVHSPENIDYMRMGIWDMLFSRISVSGKIDAAGKHLVLDAMKKTGKNDLTLTDVYSLGKEMNVDFVVCGSITKIGNSISLDGKLVDIASNKSPVGVFAECRDMDEVIPKISDFAKRINQHILGMAPSIFSLPSPPLPASPQQQTEQQSNESEIISRMKKGRGTFTSAINPDFINAARPMQRKGFWMSQKYPFQFKGMDIGDIDNDGLNEVVVIDNHNVIIYRKKDNLFTQIKKISGNSHDSYLAVDVADINSNGIPEIIVTNIKRGCLSSFVLEFRDGEFKKIAYDLRWFLRVIDVSGFPVLLGQKMSIDKPFNNPIHNIIWEKQEYREGSRANIPVGLSVYGLTIDSLGISSKERVVALNEFDHLCIFEKTDKPLSKIAVFGGSKEFLFKSEEVFGGSNNIFEPYRTREGNDDSVKDKTFVNVRILTYDTNKDGKKEIIIVKNLSSTGRIFENLQTFTSSEIYNLEWDGLGLVENWRTRKINGYVADYQFKDIDNDGRNEIVLALNMTAGGIKTSRSMLVAYDLSGEEQ